MYEIRHHKLVIIAVVLTVTAIVNLMLYKINAKKEGYKLGNEADNAYHSENVNEVAIDEDSKKNNSIEKSEEIRPYNTLDNEYLMLEELGIPGFDEFEVDIALHQAYMHKIWHHQDEIKENWPSYNEIKEELMLEMSKQSDLENLSTYELISRGIDLRRQFWEAGGCNSKTSYHYGYRARILLELAHKRQPKDLDITDELVETIQSMDSVVHYEDKVGSGGRNTPFLKTIMSYRSRQYEQLKLEIQAGRQPDFEDFVRVNDLVYLEKVVGKLDNAFEELNWLFQHAEKGGWQVYCSELNKVKKAIDKGGLHSFDIYAIEKPRKDEVRFARRLPSFKGPLTEERGVVPAHQSGTTVKWQTIDEIRNRYYRQ